MKLILSGGGSDEKAVDAFTMFADLVAGGKILYIPIADDEMTIDENLNWFKSQILPYGLTNIDVAFSAEEITRERLNSVNGVYIGVCNAFQLLHLLKSCNAFNEIKEFLNSNKVVFGTSAGTTIFGKDINSCLKDDLRIAANDKNKIGLINTEGYNILDNFSFFVHYKLKEEQLDATEQKVNRILALGTNVICLPEETNLLITENGVKVFGKMPAEVVTPTYRLIVKPNEEIKLKK